MSGLTLAFVQSGGATIDSNGENITIAQSLLDGGGGGGLTKCGSGTLTLAGTNTYAGGTTVEAGVLTASTTAALPGFASAGSVAAAGGATIGIVLANWSQTNIDALRTAAALPSGAYLGLDTSGGNATYAAAIPSIGAGGEAGLAKLGGNTLVLAGTNSYIGGTNVCGGTLQLGSSLALGSTNGALVVASSAALDMHGFAATIGALSGAGTVDNLAAGGSYVLTVGAGNSSSTFGGVIQNSSGQIELTKTGGGMLVLGGTDAYSGGTTISGGTLDIAAASALPSSGLVTIGSGGRLVLGSGLGIGGLLSVNGEWATNGSGTWSGTANWVGGNEPGAPQDTAVFGTALTSGTATVTLDSNRSLASLGFSTMGGASYVISPSNGSTLTLANTAGSATISDSGGNHTIAAPIVLGSNLSVTATTGSVLTIAGGISESGTSCAVNVSGSGELILSGTDTYTGGTTVSGGTLDIAAPSALAGSGLVTITAGGRLVLESGAGIGALLGASSPVNSGEVALSAAASAPATIENPSGNMATLGDAPTSSQGSTGIAVGGTAAAVPEPGTIALLAAGILMLAAARRRRRC